MAKAQRKNPRISIYNGLLKNAADYVNRSVWAYKDEDYKIAVVFLWSGLLLFMKSRLCQIHPALILSRLEDVVTFNPNSHHPDFTQLNIASVRNTVTFDGILDRLAQLKIDSVILQKKPELNQIKRLRNRAEHFIDDIPVSDYLAALDLTIPILNTLLEDELKEPPMVTLSCWKDLLSIETFYKDRLQRAEDYISGRLYSMYTDGEDMFTAPCENCDAGEMVNEGDVLCCHTCGYSTPFRVCTSCGTPITEHNWSTFFEETGICDECFDRIVDT